MSPLEIVATVFGLLSVALTVRQNIWCWPTGLVQVVLYIFIFYQAKLYSDSILQVLYVVFQFYGWWHWLHGGRERTSAPVTRLRPQALSGWIVVGIIGSLLWGSVMARFTDAALPYPDAFVVVLSLVAQWLLTRKVLESWHFWIAVDVLAIGVYALKRLYLTSGLYAVFLVLAVLGLLAWKKELDRPCTRPA
ncbi:nicotinamide riboside transporter PnuC [Armatimonas rosea]|uniref:Nicotinamide mononucleotide transporter n=1 Tax=Armatimonas rosea TaxID=685828 RepID=A0A7W9SPX4_ARMRO|nr:nicotinamide riboside transporter PnuC [Armatimonas rosea]MBB6050034.1 nicotinamide mononucleotide transporter [Armatimonas rosea]